MDTQATSPNAINHTAIYQKLATDHAVRAEQVQAFADLLDEGASVPFIARYRKDKTGGLDDDMLRTLEKALTHERDLEVRRNKVLDLLTAQNALTDELALRVKNAMSKLELDAIYEPYRPKRRTLSAKATLAGLRPIAERILAGESLDAALSDYTPVSTVTDEQGESFDVDYSTRELQLAGVQAIILDEWSLHLDLFDKVRTGFNTTASIHSELVGEEKREAGEKFKDYFDHTETFAKLSNHRLLAMLRGRQANVLVLSVLGEDEPFVNQIKTAFGASDTDERGQFLSETADRLWNAKWRPQIEHRLLTERRLDAETHAIGVFAQNLKHLLMTAPAGRKVILGVDPGIRHGVKMAVIDGTGDVVATDTVYPFTDPTTDKAKAVIAKLIADYGVELVAIGNGTASRESDELVRSVISENSLSAKAVVVSEAGASVYSASEIASHELPELDVSVRGAVSIARRLQDPLSELVKVEPKAIGVGQYQHDVNQAELESSLDKVTEDCVNAVGVDVNTASAPLLARISGLNQTLAKNIVAYRDEHGAFLNRKSLLKVPRLGEKTFEQAAGFLRVLGGSEPLDASAVHPEAYPVVAKILEKQGVSAAELIGKKERIAKIKATDFIDEKFGLPTIRDILAELEKPNRDPRGVFKFANFAEGINEISDLEVGMVLEGVVSNVANFGAFVDIGVHQDGLVHISALSNKFVADPREVVKAGDVVKVRVLEVDEKRKRIALTMRLDDGNALSGSPRRENERHKSRQNKPQNQREKAPTNSAMADAFAKLKR